MNESRICYEFDVLRQEATEQGFNLSINVQSFLLENDQATQAANTVAEARAFLSGWIARGRKKREPSHEAL